MSNNADVSAVTEMLGVAEREHAAASRRFVPNDRFLYAVWGIAWTIGFLGLWLSSGSNPRVDAAVAAGWLYGSLMVIAGVVTAVHIARRVSGVRGHSQILGQQFAATWFVAFASYGMVLGGLGRAAVAENVTRLLAPVLACFIVGLVYMSGGALWNDRRQFLLGVWICLVSGTAALVGNPGHLLVLAIGGGGGFLVAAAIAGTRVRVAQ